MPTNTITTLRFIIFITHLPFLSGFLDFSYPACRLSITLLGTAIRDFVKRSSMLQQRGAVRLGGRRRYRFSRVAPQILHNLCMHLLDLV